MEGTATATRFTGAFILQETSHRRSLSAPRTPWVPTNEAMMLLPHSARVDQLAVSLLTKKALTTTTTSSSLILSHPEISWSKQNRITTISSRKLLHSMPELAVLTIAV